MKQATGMFDLSNSGVYLVVKLVKIDMQTFMYMVYIVNCGFISSSLIYDLCLIWHQCNYYSTKRNNYILHQYRVARSELGFKKYLYFTWQKMYNS